MQTVTITKNDDGIRLDKLLFKIMTAPSGEVYRSLRKKKIKINGRRTTDGTVRLNAGDVVELYISDEFLNIALKNEENSLAMPKPEVVYEDENIIIMNKPSGLLAQSEDGVSLENMMRGYLRDKGEYLFASVYTPSLCHRIDRNTSGLVIGAKNINAHRVIADKIKTKELHKFYKCCVSGVLEPEIGKITGWIVKDGSGKVRFSETETSGGKYAELKYRTIAREGSSTVVEVELLSGRTHQIRASFAHIGHPIVGDVKYGAKKNGASSFQQLTAYKLVLDFKSDAGVLNYLRGRTFEV